MAAGKSKFQIVKTLDEKIKTISSNVVEFEPKFSDVSGAFIIGFQSGNTMNYLGLSSESDRTNDSLSNMGYVWFKNKPKEEEIVAIIDKQSSLNLIYYLNEETETVERKIFDNQAGTFLDNQPKLSVLDDAKIFNHSAIVKLNLSLKLDLNDDDKLLAQDKLEQKIEKVKRLFAIPSKEIKLHLRNSNYSTNLSTIQEKHLTESLYDYLDVPNEVCQMGDYLPQMTKEDKKKLADKWKNKMKNSRAPLEIDLEHSDLGFTEDDEDPLTRGDNQYRHKIRIFTYLHVNDSLLKSAQSILNLICNNLQLLKNSLTHTKQNKAIIQVNELKSCSFKPRNLGHFVQAIYQLPVAGAVNYEFLRSCRESMHNLYLIPMSLPQFRYTQRILDLEMRNPDEKAGYLCNVHSDITGQSGIKQGLKNIIEGTYTYHHYLQDRAQDSGWGCAYRSLQTIISWFKHQAYIYSPDVELREPASAKKDNTTELRRTLHREARVPTHEEIQSVLVDVGDKQHSFIGSHKWIGSQEVCYVLNHLYNLNSKFISVSSGSELVYKARDLGNHFSIQSTPVMIGGGVLAHTIIGLDFNEKNGDISYLILDPHYSGDEDLSIITKKGWCGWKKNSFWDKNAFYNLCLPQRPADEI